MDSTIIKEESSDCNNLYTDLLNELSQVCNNGNDSETFLIDSFPLAIDRMQFFRAFGKLVDGGLIHLTNQKALIDNSDPDNLKSYTYNGFMLQGFGIDCHEYSVRYKDTYGSEIEQFHIALEKLSNYNFEEIQGNSKVIVFDEYPKAPAWLLVMIYFTCKTYKLHLIFVGDKYELKNFETNFSHSRTQNSYYLLTILADRQLTFPKAGITADETYSKNFEEFVELLEKKGTHDNVNLTFDLLYFLYSKFENKFYNADEFRSETIFMAQYHKSSTARLLKYNDHLISKPIYRDVLYKAHFWNNENVELIASSEEFLPYLILVPGDKYIYTKRTETECVKKLVVLLDINAKEHCLSIQDDNNIEFKIYREMMTGYEIHPNLKKVLSRTHKNIDKLYQYPLKPYNVSTYHAVQCLTVPILNVELNLDGASANSAYVALSRINSENQISKIHSTHLDDLEITKHFKGKNSKLEYYYKTSVRPVLEELKEEEFIEVDTISEFESSWKPKIKIKTSKYKEAKPGHPEDTTLISVTRFGKYLFDLTNTVDISFEDLKRKYTDWKMEINKKIKDETDLEDTTDSDSESDSEARSSKKLKT